MRMYALSEKERVTLYYRKMRKKSPKVLMVMKPSLKANNSPGKLLKKSSRQNSDEVTKLMDDR